MIPKQATFLHDCIKSFRKLKQVIDLAKIDNPDFLNAMPIFGNFIFNIKMRASNKKFWETMNINTLGSLINKDTNKPLTRSNFVSISKSYYSNKPPSFHRARSGQQSGPQACTVLTMHGAPLRYTRSGLVGVALRG